MGRGRGHYRPVVKVDVKTRSVITRYPSIAAAATANGLRVGSIHARCNSKVRSTSAFYFRFEDSFDPAEDIAIRHPKKNPLSDREKQTLALIITSIEEHQAAPTLMEIAKFLDVSKERASQLVRALEKKGLVERDAGVKRGIRVAQWLLKRK